MSVGTASNSRDTAPTVSAPARRNDDNPHAPATRASRPPQMHIGRGAYSAIGVDWGSTSLCLAQWRKGRSGPVAHAVSTLRPSQLGTPAGFSLADLATQTPAGVVAAVRDALNDHGMKGKRWAVGITAPEIEFHLLDLPLPKNGPLRTMQAELDQAAHFEIQRLMHLADEQVETDWWPLPAERRSNTSAVGAVVSSRCVNGVCRWVNDCGYDCIRLDATACALARFCYFLARPGDQEIWGVLDLGARGARLIICVESVPVMVRAFDHGQDRWTQRIAEAMQLSTESAEQLKIEFGIDFSAPQGRGLRPVARIGEGIATAAQPVSAESAPSPASSPRSLAQVGAMIYTTLRPDLEQIARELERSFQYVLQSFPTRKASTLLLAGGGAAMRHLDVLLRRDLGIQVFDIESLRNAPSADLSRLPPGALRTHGAALGLALVPN